MKNELIKTLKKEELAFVSGGVDEKADVMVEGKKGEEQIPKQDEAAAEEARVVGKVLGVVKLVEKMVAKVERDAKSLAKGFLGRLNGN